MGQRLYVCLLVDTTCHERGWERTIAGPHEVAHVRIFSEQSPTRGSSTLCTVLKEGSPREVNAWLSSYGDGMNARKMLSQNSIDLLESCIRASVKTAENTADAARVLLNALESGKHERVAAIKLLRERTGCSIKDAKDRVDEIATKLRELGLEGV